MVAVNVNFFGLQYMKQCDADSPTESNNKMITIYIDNFYYTYYLSCSYILVCTFIHMSYNGFVYNTVSHKYPLPYSLSQNCNTQTRSDSYVCLEEITFEQLKVSLSSHMTAGVGGGHNASWVLEAQLSTQTVSNSCCFVGKCQNVMSSRV